MIERSRTLTNSNDSARGSSQTGRAPKRSETLSAFSVEARNAEGHKGPGVPGGGEFVFFHTCTVGEEETLTAFENDSIHHILHVRLKKCVPGVE